MSHDETAGRTPEKPIAAAGAPPARRRLPPWFRVSMKGAAEREEVRVLLDSLRLNTVCQSAQCPNLCECWRKRTATFMILGNECTRNCRFCAVAHGSPPLPESDEPTRVAEATAELGLKFIVITSVTRDDLPDGGAAHFAATIQAVRDRCPQAGIEVLTPDFGGRECDIRTVLDARPTVFNHNIETCRRLTRDIRSGADYDRSLAVLATAARLAGHNIIIKSGFMLGMGETADEIRAMLADLRTSGVSMATIGQYLPPSRHHWQVDRFVTPEEFDQWGKIAREEYGFRAVASAPLVRSSYMAENAARAARGECRE